MKSSPFGDLYAGIEAGGTRFVCAVGSSPENLRDRHEFRTATPDETLEEVIFFLKREKQQNSLRAIGIASFGPLDLRPESGTYGFITGTPKPGWSNIDIKGRIQDALDVPVFIDTDVNGAALAESIWGASRGLDTSIYLTVGTGIGGGGLIEGRLMHGDSHPEMGHLRIPQNPAEDPFPGSCPFHGNCLEGLASGYALQQRWRKPAESLPADHPAWHLEARYLACGIANLVCTLSPQIIILGGGVMKKRGLIEAVRELTVELLNGYIRSPRFSTPERYIVAPALSSLSGVLGAIALARQGLQEV